MNYILPTIDGNQKTSERKCTAVLKDIIRLDISRLSG
jgi:hypothetical protein